MGRLSKISRILRREGLGGILNRVRHTPLLSFLPPPPPPRFDEGVRLIDHGHPDYSARIGDILTRYGITLLKKRDPADLGIVWHIGIPAQGGRNEVIVIPPGTEAGGKRALRKLRRAALVLDHDPGRLKAFGGMQAGRPHVMALPPVPGDDAALSRAIERVLIFAESRPPTIYDFRPDLPPEPIPQLCLGLPEHPARLQSFLRRGLPGFHIIHGLRRQPGWIGAANSYCQIARTLLDTGRKAAIICQDDADPGPDFERRFAAAIAYWQDSGADLFSGLVTDVDDSFRITRVTRRDGMTFVHLNRNIGLVCTMFGPRALERLAAWDEGGRSVNEGTIDRYLGATPDLDVVTCLPFLVRHRDGVASSIWNFRNGRYNTLIDYSEKQLIQMAAAFEQTSPDEKPKT